MNELKDVLKYLRNREGISQAELALRLGVTPSAIGNYESGTRMPTSEIEESLADYFNVSLDFLRGIDSERSFSSDEVMLIQNFRLLNSSGRQEAMSHMEYLCSQERYKKDTGSPADSGIA
jgi:transcriptional regulator with XRE-family HTH domain